MAYARELDSLRQELRKDVAGTVISWARVDGMNVQVSATAGHCTYQVYNPSGASIQGPTNIDGTLVGDVDRFDVPVSAIGTLGEDYRVDLLWRQASSSVIRRDAIYFDVVLVTFDQPLIGLNDLLEERPDVGEILDRHGQILGYTAGATAQTTAAAIYATRAHVELDALIRNQISADAAAASSAADPSLRSVVRTRPNLILNRERLRRVEAKIAMREIYAADNRNDDPDGTWVYRHYADTASAAWASIGPLKYDESQDMVADAVLDDIGRVVIQRRVQG